MYKSSDGKNMDLHPQQHTQFTSRHIYILPVALEVSWAEPVFRLLLQDPHWTRSFNRFTPIFII